MQNFKILTKKSILDIQEEISELSSDLQEIALNNFYEEQNKLFNNEYYAIHFLEDKHYIDESYAITNDIYESIECLAIKDGFDVVQFENGKKGIIAYYNCIKNGFEFIEISEKQYNNLYEEMLDNEEMLNDKIKKLFK